MKNNPMVLFLIIATVEAAVFGAENADGSVTAANVSLNPQFMRGR